MLTRMGKDKRCFAWEMFECSDCDEYETTGTVSILCEYCGHRPVEHEIIRGDNTEETTPAKKQRLEATEEILEIDFDHSEAQMESTEDEPFSVSGLVSGNTKETQLAEDIAVSPSESSTTENEVTSPHAPERSAEVIEVSADVDTELEDQQIKANELAKKEAGVTFKIKRQAFC